MDSEQEELQFLGFSGIYAESFKIISTWKKLFTQITLTLVLPLCFIFLVQSKISQIIFNNIEGYELELSMIEKREQAFRHRVSNLLTSEWITLCLFKVAYITFALIFSLLSNSAVVYTIASIYTRKNLTFKKVMSVVPKVWKRLIITFIWSYAIFIPYNLIFFFSVIRWDNRVDILLTLLVFYTVGLVYLTMIWQLASVVSVLEDVYGREAMLKSKALIKGKMGVSVFCFSYLVLTFVGIMLVFEVFAAGYALLPFGRVLMGVVCLVLLVLVVLVGLVVQTVIYFVCKSYHHESIDKSVLAVHLDVYLGDYVLLKAKDVQLEQLHA